METAVGAALLPGLALGGVLAIAGAWSRLARGAALPHLGVGALAGVLAVCALRMVLLPGPVVLLLTALAGGLAGLALAVLDARVRSQPDQRPLLADVAVLAVLVAAGTLLRPATAIPLPFGPLGGQAGTAAAVAALLIGGAGAWSLGSRVVDGLAPALRWAAAGALLGLAVALAAGAVGATTLAFGGIIGLPDTAGLALRALAVGLAARRDAWDAIAAGLALGVAETVLAVMVPLSGLSLVPLAVALGIGLVVHLRDRAALR